MSDAGNLKEIQRKVFDLTLALYRVTDFFPKDEALKRSLREKANEIFGLASEYELVIYENSNVALIFGKIQAMKGFLEIARSLQFVKPINFIVLEREYGMLADFFVPRPAPVGDEESPAEAVEYKTDKTPEHNETIEESLPTWEEFSFQKKPQPGSQEPKTVLTPEEPDYGPIQPQTAAPLGAPDNQEERKETDLTPIQKDLSERQKTILEHLKNSKQAKVSDFYSFFDGISTKTVQRDLQDLVGRNVLKKEGDRRWTIYSLTTVL